MPTWLLRGREPWPPSPAMLSTCRLTLSSSAYRWELLRPFLSTSADREGHLRQTLASTSPHIFPMFPRSLSARTLLLLLWEVKPACEHQDGNRAVSDRACRICDRRGR